MYTKPLIIECTVTCQKVLPDVHWYNEVNIVEIDGLFITHENKPLTITEMVSSLSHMTDVQLNQALKACFPSRQIQLYFLAALFPCDLTLRVRLKCKNLL